MSRVLVMMGSESDRPTMAKGVDVLEEAGIDVEVVVSSAHRDPVRTAEIANAAATNGFDVVICGAMSQMCIDATSRAAADFGYAVTVVEDACGAKDAAFGGVEVPAAQVHAAFMAPLAMSYAKVVTADELLNG